MMFKRKKTIDGIPAKDVAPGQVCEAGDGKLYIRTDGVGCIDQQNKWFVSILDGKHVCFRENYRMKPVSGLFVENEDDFSNGC